MSDLYYDPSQNILFDLSKNEIEKIKNNRNKLLTDGNRIRNEKIRIENNIISLICYKLPFITFIYFIIVHNLFYFP
jgi:hypothetical protein